MKLSVSACGSCVSNDRFKNACVQADGLIETSSLLSLALLKIVFATSH